MHFILLTSHPVIVTAPLAFWTWVGNILVPIVTAFVAHRNAPAGFKALVNAFLSAVTSLVVYALAHNGGFDLWSWALATLSGLFVAWAAYAGVWRQTVAPAIEANTGGIGAARRAA